MSIYDEARAPGSAIPNTDVLRPDTNGGAGGVVLPSLRRFMPLEFPAYGGMSHDVPASVVAAAPRGSDGIAGERYDAAISRRVDMSAPSVVSTIFQATPIGNVANVARELPAIDKRPLLPPGLRERAVEALPRGIASRAASWSRLLEKLATRRPTFPRLPVARE